MYLGDTGFQWSNHETRGVIGPLDYAVGLLIAFI